MLPSCFGDVIHTLPSMETQSPEPPARPAPSRRVVQLATHRVFIDDAAKQGGNSDVTRSRSVVGPAGTRWRITTCWVGGGLDFHVGLEGEVRTCIHGWWHFNAPMRPHTIVLLRVRTPAAVGGGVLPA